MKTEQTAPKNRTLDGVLWAVVAAIIIAVAVLNSIYADESLFYRVLGALVLAIIAGAIAVRTSQGAAFWHIAQGAKTEVKRVVWPTQSERNRATLMVVVVIFFMAVILWGLDGLFGWLAGMLLR